MPYSRTLKILSLRKYGKMMPNIIPECPVQALLFPLQLQSAK